MVSLINGDQFYLWRAVDEDGNVLDILMQKRRDKAAAKNFFRKLKKQQGFAPRVMVTDKLKSYGATKRDLLLKTDHRQDKGLNNPCGEFTSADTNAPSDERGGSNQPDMPNDFSVHLA